MSRRLIAVLGMHRSGTSLATRGLQALGAGLGDELLEHDASNPTGYWENAAVLGLNERLLQAQGLHWDAACEQPKWVPDQDAFHEEGCDLLRATFGDVPLIGVKDPRMSRLLWFWQPVFRELGLATSYLLVVRDPQEVLGSLRARSPIGTSQAHFLWMLHYLDALEDRDGTELTVVNYADLVAAPIAALRRISTRFALPQGAEVEDAIALFGAFVDENLWRQRDCGGAGSDMVSKTAAALYAALRLVARDEATLDSSEVLRAIGTARELIAGVSPVLELAAISNGQAWMQRRAGELKWGARLNPRMPAVISAGESVRVEVICTNEGSRRWAPTRPSGRRLALSYHLRDRSGAMVEQDGERTSLRAFVDPGDQTVLQGNFTAPAAPGDYFVEWDMVSEGECWFGEVGSATAMVAFRVAVSEQEMIARYPAEVMPAAGWSPRFRKAPEEVRVAIAVRTWNVIEHKREAMLERTLESLRAAGHPFELILFDNGSTDGTAELVAAQGGTLGLRTEGKNTSGQGMNLAIELGLETEPDLVVFSDDDIEWQPGFLARLVQFWSHAPHDLVLASGFVEAQLKHNAIRGTIDSGGVRALVRETAPGGAWSFPAAHWRWIGPLEPGMEADWEACLRLRAAGFRLAQLDLAEHLGAGRSTWGNEVSADRPVRAKLLRAQPLSHDPTSAPETGPKLSVVAVCYEMAEQIANTLRSLVPPYQRDVALSEYEILLIDNGSRERLPAHVLKIAPNLRYLYLSPNEASGNPAAALNLGAAEARGAALCFMIDGARMLTPGVLSWGLRLLARGPKAMVEVRGWHLGPRWQPESVMEGYDRAAERLLLERIRWPEEGYRLWEIAAATPQVSQGYSARTTESNCIFMSRELFSEIGGYDERARSAGGGLVNHDFFKRAVARADTVVTLLGEGNFHQAHGGAATGLAVPDLTAALKEWRAESEALGQTIAPTYEFTLAGHMPKECAAWLARQAQSSAGESAPPFLYLDPEMVGLLRLFEVDLVLDVGANRGQFALELIRAGYAGRILSFEPLSEAHAALLEASRDYPQWKVAERCALGEREGETVINVAGNLESSSLLPILAAHTAAAPASRYVATEKVALRTLERVAAPDVATAARPFLKLDVQGFESQVLKGSTSLLPKLAGLQVELDIVPLYEGSVLLEDMLEHVRSLGFALYRIRPGFTDRRLGRMLQVDGLFFRDPPPSDWAHGY